MKPNYSAPSIPPHEVIHLAQPDVLGVTDWKIWWLTAQGEPTVERSAHVYVAHGFDRDALVAVEKGGTTKGWEEFQDLILGLDNYEEGQPAAVIELERSIPMSRLAGAYAHSTRDVYKIEVRCSGPEGFGSPKRLNADYFLNCFLVGGGEIHVWSRDARYRGIDPNVPVGAPLRFALPRPGTVNRPSEPRKEAGPTMIRANQARPGDYFFVEGRLVGHIADVTVSSMTNRVELAIRDLSLRSRVIKLPGSRPIEIERFSRGR
ncbi:MAG TPA: hypothetical protein VFK89_11270 [Actinomycetota bacterium]|nr:hypothetical protein [Actinomycetota bacterium]